MSVTIASGLTLGAVYAVIALGLVLSLLPTGAFNFAQGAATMAGGYVGYWWMTQKGYSELSAIAVVAVAGVAIGALSEIICIRPLRWQRRRGAGGEMAHTDLITTVGMATVLTGVAGVIWGYDPRTVPFRGSDKPVTILGAPMRPVEIIVIATAIVLAVVLQLWSRLTRTGQSVLAAAEDRDAAMLRGINVSMLSVAAWAVSGLIGAVAGLAITPVTYAFPELAHLLVLPAFVALSIGGFGSFVGAFGGAMVLGLVTAFANRYLGAQYKDLVILSVLLLTYTVRPQGLGGIGAARTV
jgi:branched-chain amino acid transport system permease protein